MSTEAPTPIETEALSRLKHRVIRMARLIELGAPFAILTTEASLIADAGKMLSPETWYNRERQDFEIRTRRALHLCEDCDEMVAEVPRESAPYHSSCCAEHAAATLKLLKEDFE